MSLAWTHNAPGREFVGRYFWKKTGDSPPQVVLITRWSGQSTAYAGIRDSLDASHNSVYVRDMWIARPESPTPMMAGILSHTLWAGPIEEPEEVNHV